MNRPLTILALMTVISVSSCNSYQRKGNVVADKMSVPALKDTRLEGAAGAKMENFFEKRIFSDYAKSTIMQEAEDAFKNKVDDIVKAPIGYWQGEFWGKMMISASRVAMYHNDPEQLRYISEEAHRLLQYQEKDGYLGTYADKTYVTSPDLVEAKKAMGWDCDWCWNLWCRKYTMWGLLLAYEATGERELLDAVVKSMDQEIKMLDELGLKVWDTGTPHFHGLPSCSVLKPLMQLYRLTGYERYLAFGKEIVDHWKSDASNIPALITNSSSDKPIREWYPEPHRWAKAYEMMSCLDGMLEYYRVTGDKECFDAVAKIQKNVWATERNPLESVGFNDQFTGGSVALNGISEPCDAIHWMRLNHDLFRLTGDPTYVDVIEQTFFNAFLAGVFRNGTWGARGVRSEGVHLTAHGQAMLNHNHCCVNNMPRGFMDIAQTLISKDDEGVLYVNWYSDSKASIDGINVEVSGGYPISDKVCVKINADKPTTVKFRIPAWSKHTTVNGQKAAQGWFETKVERTSEFSVAFDMTPEIIDNHAPAMEDIDHDHIYYRRWLDSDKKLAQYFRTKPCARIKRGPMILAKSRFLGDDVEIYSAESINGEEWTCTVSPIDCGNVWGAWDLTLSKGAKTKTFKVCDYSSAGDFEGPEGGEMFFSIYF